ncbi:MAG TPA: dihydrolipoamide acetyltransferase family protein [Nitrososphaerales archaeon]|nr:dihydrolipoamide acetyltransferase family protein [Nitrososphaerales archaeon]
MVEFKLPDLGEGVAEGEIVKWLVSDGQEIKEDQPMVEVMTDKATVQIPSPVNARVRQILAREGQTVTVGTSLVILDNGGAQPLPSVKPVQAEQEKQQVAPVSRAASARVMATPALRKLARDLGVEIETVRGSGESGRIMEDDVRKAAANKGSIPTVQPVQIERASGAIAGASPGSEEHVSIHGIRKRIAEKMMKSVRTTAPVTHVEEVDFSELVRLREKSKPLAEAKGVKLTFLPFIIKSVVTALKQYPYFNASLDEEKQEIIVKHYYNIGFATDTPNGLIVPVLKDADRMTILEIAREIFSLSESARTGKIQLEDIQGGTFTITNIGVLGGISSTPIINVPEVAILGVHKIQKRPVVRGEQIVIRDIANVALTFDHRVQDGADAARFTGLIAKYLESPGLLLLESQLGLQ